MSNPQAIANAVTKVGASLGLSNAKVEAMLPHVFRTRNAFRDAAYMVVDFPFLMKRMTGSYGYFRKYLRQMRKHGRANPEDFKDADLNELRTMVNNYYHMRGPLMKIDMRIFNYMYVIMGIIIVYEAYKIQKGIDNRMDMGGVSWDDRRNAFDDDYEEDIKRR